MKSNRLKLAKELQRTAEAKRNNSGSKMPQGGYKQSQPVCHKPQGNRPGRQASRPNQSTSRKSEALGAHLLPLQHKIKHSQLSTHKVPARLTC